MMARAIVVGVITASALLADQLDCSHDNRKTFGHAHKQAERLLSWPTWHLAAIGGADPRGSVAIQEFLIRPATDRARQAGVMLEVVFSARVHTGYLASHPLPLAR
jgi:hypothetical protein